MQRWNGWGDDTIQMELSPKAKKFLQETIGEGNAPKDYPLENFLKQVPKTRLSDHPLITTASKERLIHSHGQSLPDWVNLRCGTLPRFPDGVAHPTTTEEIEELLSFAEMNNIIVIPYGGGTSVVGHLHIPEGDRPVLSLSLRHLNRLTVLDTRSLLATFEAGVLGPEIEAQLRPKGLTLGHYPQSFDYSSLGGWIMTRSSGQQSAHYGRIEDLFAGGDMITPGGTLHLPPFPASAAGPDIRQIVMGSEGRMGVLTSAIMRVSPLPEKDEVYGVFFPSWEQAADAVRSAAGNHLPFSMLRVSNQAETMTNLMMAGNEKHVELLRFYLRLRNVDDACGCMCLIGFTGPGRLVSHARQEIFSVFREYEGVPVGKAMGEAWKKNRFQAPYLRNTLWDMGYAVDTLETAVTWDKVLSATQAIEAGLKSENENIHVFTHLSHVYPTGSSIYTTYIFRVADTPEETLSQWKALKSAASRAVVESGGTISHQHGVGTDHAPYLEAEKGKIGMDALRQICTHFDPEGIMNTGKMLV